MGVNDDLKDLCGEQMDYLKFHSTNPSNTPKVVGNEPGFFPLKIA